MTTIYYNNFDLENIYIFIHGFHDIVFIYFYYLGILLAPFEEKDDYASLLRVSEQTLHRRDAQGMNVEAHVHHCYL